jgi:hypothetical protein
MKILPVMRLDHSGRYVIARERQPSFFSFFIDGDKSSWTKHSYNARTYKTRAAAQGELLEIRHRQRLMRLQAKEPHDA